MEHEVPHILSEVGSFMASHRQVNNTLTILAQDDPTHSMAEGPASSSFAIEVGTKYACVLRTPLFWAHV